MKITTRKSHKLKIITSALVISLMNAPSIHAGTWVDSQSQTARVSAKVVKDDMVILRTDKAFKEIRVANASIADVVVLSDQSFQVLGKAGGKTNVMLYDAQRRLVDIVDVNVEFNISGLKKSLFETFPNERIEVRSLAGGLYLSGDVSTENVYKRVEKIAQAFAPDHITNGLDVKDSHQVMLQVRFVEASRNAIKELGINILTQRNQGPTAGIEAGDFSLSAGSTIANAALDGILGGGIGAAALDIQIQALEEKGVIRTLAQPNLVSMSGETASFLAGGEFPIPVPSGLGQVGIEYRKFGVGLAFTPTVLDDGVINLQVAPEVSQLDQASAVNIAGVSVPGLRVRRANTTIELRNSQSFAIAGLLQTTSTNDRNQVPWLSDVPILGSLFSSTSYQESETELVIIVTPYLAQPVSDVSQLATPFDYITKPSDFDSFANGQIEGPEVDTPTLSGSYGHAIQ
ncbi:MAG: type II and III secretion system protein family protein [Litorimonas sp.]